MPIMNAKFLDTDPEGAELLRSVLDTGRRRKITDLLGLRDLRPAEAPRPITVEVGEADEEMMHPGVLAAVAE
jgi:hypothetical protein